MMAMRRDGRLMVAVHSSVPPTDAEWTRWVSFGLEAHSDALRLFVETKGRGGPNAKQRRLLADNLQPLGMRCAILTGSPIVRGIVTAVAWLNVDLRAFAVDDHEAAMSFLQLSAAEREFLQRTLPALRAEADAEPTDG
jgi:hypothetical protein